MKKQLSVLAIAAALTFISTLTLYSILSGRSPFPRLGYALFVSVFPALVMGVVLSRIRLTVTIALMVYVVVLFLTLSLQWLLR